ncbi:hypothetical protein VPH49_21980 [Pseudomonas luteola]|uniref:hypothetical protein n=1 Tax=Pseudomonas luteola TaxID=47886 RepID=UPI003A89B5E1
MSDTPLADQLATISRDEFTRYLNTYSGTQTDLINSLDDSTVDTSVSKAQTDAVRSRDTLSRMRERYGSAQTTAAQASENRTNNLSGALGQMTAGNNAIVADQDNKVQSLQSLLGVGNTVRQQSLGNFQSASGAEASRVSTNKSISAQNKASSEANKQQAISSAAAIAMTAALIF